MSDGLDLGTIRAFVAVVRARSFSEGAGMVGLTRSAAGKALARLEERLGTRLLHRTTRLVALTADGEAFYNRCQQILADLDEAEAEVRQDQPEPRGLLRITVPDAFGRQKVLPVLHAYLKDWPALSAEVSITDRIVDVAEEGYDLAIRCGGPLANSRLIARVVARFRAILCAAPDYLAARGEPLSGDDLLLHDRLSLGGRGDTRAWQLTSPSGELIRIVDAGRLLLDSGEALRQASVAGLGVAYLPSFLAEPDLAAGRLRPLLVDHQTEEMVAHALYPSRRHVSAKVRLLVDRLGTELGGP